MSRYRINIPRPYPGTGENEKQISFIEPLRKKQQVFVSGAYYFNLDAYIAGQQPSLSPGFKYVFEFVNLEDVTAFKLKFGGNEKYETV